MEFTLILAFCSIFSLMYSTEAAVSIGLSSANKDYPGMCWDSHNRIAYPVGRNYPKGTCSLFICSGKDFSYEIQTCGAIGVPPGYTLESDMSQQYPNCCPRPVKDDNPMDGI